MTLRTGCPSAHETLTHHLIQVRVCGQENLDPSDLYRGILMPGGEERVEGTVQGSGRSPGLCAVGSQRSHVLLVIFSLLHPWLMALTPIAWLLTPYSTSFYF